MARIAFLIDEMFEDSEFRLPYDRVRGAGHEAVIVGLVAGKQLAGKRGKEAITTEVAVEAVSADEFDALVIPGGYSPDHIRMSTDAIDLTRAACDRGKPIAAVCHAGWMLIEAGIADGRTLTSWPSIKTDLVNAGARWIDRHVVEDGNLITSRRPEDLPAFSDALLRQLERGAAPRLEAVIAPGQRSLLDRIVWYLRAHQISFRLTSRPSPESLPDVAFAVSPASVRVQTRLLLVGGRPAIACVARGAKVSLQRLAHELGVPVSEAVRAYLPPPYTRASGPIPPLGGAMDAITIVDAGVTNAPAIAFEVFSAFDCIELPYDDFARHERPRVASFAIGGELPEQTESEAASRQVA